MLDALLERFPHLLRGRDWVLCIDGRSGAGKTRLAQALAQRVDARILHVEDLYHGWDDLAGGSARVAEALDRGQWRRFHWPSATVDATVRDTPRPPLIIEGCGSITPTNLDAAQRRADTVTGVWIECPEELRRSRALDRDGEALMPFWDRWARQEEQHMRVNDPVGLSHAILACGNDYNG